MGSNRDRECNMEAAIARLKIIFPEIYFAEPVVTEFIGRPDADNFLNQVAIVCTTCSQAEVLSIIKGIEKDLGRKPEDKFTGSIPIDIDLLQWNEEILKPADLGRDYIIAGVRLITEKYFR